MPRMNGYDLIRAITAQYPEVRILVFSAFLTPFSQQRIKTLGAHATICKSESGQTIVRAVEEVIRGNSFHSKVYYIHRDMAAGEHDDGLTCRQNQVLGLIGQGKTTREISQCLGISPWTVDKHRSNIKEKLGLRTLAEMIRYAINMPLKKKDSPMEKNNVHILIIDDETAVLKVLKQMLMRENFAVDTAESGQEGLQKIHSGEYDLVITDIKMPGMSGTQVARAVRSLQCRDLPVIGMSGTPWLLDRDLFDAVLPKPFLRTDLLTAVTHIKKF